MKRYLLATASSLILIGTASAADLPTPAPAYTKAPASLAPNWTGPYWGLSVGAIRSRTKASIYEAATLSYTPSLRDTNVTLGGQIGYNWQWDNFVYGLEADINWSRARASTTSESTAFGDEFADVSSRMNWYGTFRARAGILLAPPTLLYATGGIAFAGIKDRAEQLDGAFEISRSGTRTGWTAGGGIEHQFGHNYSVKAEVLYMDFGRKSASDDFYTGHFKNTAVVGRLGVNVRW